MLTLLAALCLTVVPDAGVVCVPRTSICAPEGSRLDGQERMDGIGGGDFTLTPTAPVRALTALFKKDVPLTASVRWWSPPGRRIWQVTVEGELEGEQTISGVRVSGKVSVSADLVQPLRPQLVRSSREVQGPFLLLGEKVTLGGPSLVQGSLDMGDARAQITGTGLITVRGLNLKANPPLTLELRGEALRVAGTLEAPQQVGALMLSGRVDVTLAGQKVEVRSATLAAPASLELLGLPPGEAPAGTEFATTQWALVLRTPGRVVVCGVEVEGVAVQGEPKTISLTRDVGTQRVTVAGLIVGPVAARGDGPTVSGQGTLSLPLMGCEGLGATGSVGSGQRLDGLVLATGSTLNQQPINGVEWVSGRLASAQKVGDLVLRGEFSATHPKPGTWFPESGTLGAPGRIDAWELPAGTAFKRGAWGLQFTTPRGAPARAVAPHRGLTIGDVIEAKIDEQSSQLTLARPTRVPGVELSSSSIGIDARSGCISATVAQPQSVGLLTLPANGAATFCRGTLVAGSGDYAVPSLRFGRSYGTALVAGSRAKMSDQPPTEPPGPSGGYWLQINSLCQGPSGIPRPPPPTQWVFLDQKAEPSAKDRKVLDEAASKPGQPCRAVPCCVP